MLAREEGADVLSADSMLVYRGMDIGTAKPSRREQEEVRYWGIDMVGPDQAFSTGDYVAYAREALARVREDGRHVLVVGGTGLYLKCLTEGLDTLPSADPGIRAEMEGLLEKQGVKGLQAALQKKDPDAYTHLQDKENPRRLIRALELAAHGVGRPGAWQGRPQIPLIGLRMDAKLLAERIQERVVHMYELGLLDEVSGLLERYGALSTTAAQAIGYREAIECLQGACGREEAMARTVTRTRQLAKRQMTWFRHQARVAWIDIEPGMADAALAQQVLEAWRTHGSTPIAI